MSNGPRTYKLDGHQYLLVGAGANLFAFAMNEQAQHAVAQTILFALTSRRKQIGMDLSRVMRSQIDERAVKPKQPACLHPFVYRVDTP
jgi:hypothetical protein